MSESTPESMPESVGPKPESPATGLKTGGVRLAHLDGLRALAALFVVGGHASSMSLGATTTSGGLTGLLVRYGHLAVDVFIVLSGYCLMLPVPARGGVPGGALGFYRRRARRILPPYYAALALTALVSALGWHEVGAAPITRRDWLVNLMLLQNWLSGHNTIDSPTWSVAVEWQIYFLFPALALLWRRSGPLPTVAAAALVGLSVTAAAPLLLGPLHYNAPWYVLLFGLGLCAGAVHGRRVPGGALAAVALTSAGGVIACYRTAPAAHARDWLGALPAAWWLPALDACVGALACAALLGLAQGDGPAARALSWRPLVAIGTFSYSLYLVHFPLLSALRGLTHWAGRLSVFGLEVPLAVGGAYLFFLAFERPFLTRRRGETPGEVAQDAALSPAP
jgi:peptidoglycan/LPS O-acetylase OafA/YrhL